MHARLARWSMLAALSVMLLVPTIAWSISPMVADGSVTISDAPDPVSQGESITYTLAATNAGPDATSFQVWMDTPAGTTFVSATTADLGWTPTLPSVGSTGGEISFAKASVSVAESATFTVVVEVDPEVAVGSAIDAVANLSASGDPNSLNNSSTTTTMVQAPDSGSGGGGCSAAGGGVGMLSALALVALSLRRGKRRG